MLDISGVSKSYGNNRVLDDVSLAAAPGEIVALLGPNGAGKTTLLSIVAGLRGSDSGRIVIGGHDLDRARASAIALVGIAPQDTGVQLMLSARQNLDFYARLGGLDHAERQRYLAWVIDALGIGPFVDQRTSELSGGQRRRVHTACAVATKPSLLLLDEPTVGADLEMRGELLGLVKTLAADGITVIYTTHYLPEVEQLDARVVMLEQGRVLIDLPLNTLLDGHANSMIELEFNGDAPTVTIDGLHIDTSGSVLRVTGAMVSTRTAEVITALGSNSTRLRTVEVVNANLDSAYLSLTGRRFTEQ